MNKTKIFFAVVLINIVIIAGIVNELGLDENEVDTSTVVTAKLSIAYSNAGDNDTIIFEAITTTESTVFGLLMSGSDQGNYDIRTVNEGQGVTVTNIIINNCEECQEEEGYSWQYTLNGFYSDIPSNRNIITNGDVIEWIYTNEV
ncbi:MAG: hypothetical protein BEU00_01220 [Marine Group III euryarchaeote CG-Epi3]|jgi:hypothetical protein|uniref:DUF4430 domain-containing protein n=1 Tax=Marine Group III euryarchaeote CG-Epi3 TaxID=1888997 RepID=A0A1J5TQ03_9ARCH|nr:MAG: hypothetical protein BEU00_01220 [Marine Group III euryarchaeote CG-Epi3]|tara:strand:+ start:1519 stop:1953 length:435 start_codon:yes stop_codon:yes gene_type:complete